MLITVAIPKPYPVVKTKKVKVPVAVPYPKPVVVDRPGIYHSLLLSLISTMHLWAVDTLPGETTQNRITAVLKRKCEQVLLFFIRSLSRMGFGVQESKHEVT